MRSAVAARHARGQASAGDAPVLVAIDCRSEEARTIAVAGEALGCIGVADRRAARRARRVFPAPAVSVASAVVPAARGAIVGTIAARIGAVFRKAARAVVDPGDLERR